MSSRERWRRSIRRGTAAIFGRAGNLATRVARRVAPADAANLQGDRTVEWSFCIAKLARGEGNTLDFGAGDGFLALAAAQRGHNVVALDQVPVMSEYRHGRVTIVCADILDRPLADLRVDQIINCSSVEHVGLAGRYGSVEAPDGDLEAMGILRGMLVSSGQMILTIPVGRDMVCRPLHRIYGEQRLPRLIEGFEILEEQYWGKDSQAGWVQTEPAIALATEGSESFYSLGLFVLMKPEDA